MIAMSNKELNVGTKFIASASALQSEIIAKWRQKNSRGRIITYVRVRTEKGKTYVMDLHTLSKCKIDILEED